MNFVLKRMRTKKNKKKDKKRAAASYELTRYIAHVCIYLFDISYNDIYIYHELIL